MASVVWYFASKRSFGPLTQERYFYKKKAESEAPVKKKEAGQDFNTIMKASGSTGGGRLVDTFFRLTTNMVLTRMLGAEIFGIFILGRTTVMVMSMISNLGMGLGVVRQIAFYAAQKDEDHVQQSIRIALIIPGILSVLTALLLFFGGDHVALSFFKKPALALPLKILVFAIPIITISQILLEVLRGFKKITRRVIVEYFLIPIANLLLIALFYFLGFKLEGAIIAFMVSNFMAFIILILFHRHIIKPIGPGPLFKKDEFLRFFKFSLPLTFVSVFNELKLRLDIIILGLLTTAANTSIYFIACRLASFLAMPSQASHMIFAPMVSGYYARGEIDKIESNYKNLTKMMFIGSMFLLGFIVIFSTELLSFFGPEFKKGKIVVVLVCLGQLVKTVVGNAGIILVMVGKPILNLLIMIVTVVLLAVLNILLIPKLGIIGAGLANLTTVTVTSLMELSFVYHYLHIHPFRKDFLKCLNAGLIGGGIVFFLKKLVLPPHFLSAILLMITFGILYFTILYIQKLTVEELDFLAKVKQTISELWRKMHKIWTDKIYRRDFRDERNQ